MKSSNPKHLNLNDMWKVYELSKGSFDIDHLDGLSIPEFFADMIGKLPKGAYVQIIGMLINKNMDDVLKMDSLDLASIFMSGMVRNDLISFHRFVEDLSNAKRD